MARSAEFSKQTRRDAFARANGRCEDPECGRKLTCAACGKEFVRAYLISATRTANNQYCSRACQQAARRAIADATVRLRFMKYVQVGKPAECWPWAGQRDNRGYGRFNWRRGDTQLAHRLSYRIAHDGVLAPELDVCHSCDNPNCVNPAHLWLGTHSENMLDMVRKGRWSLSERPVRRGEWVNTAKLSESQVRAIRASHLPSFVLSETYGVSRVQINNIRSGRQWKHVT